MGARMLAACVLAAAVHWASPARAVAEGPGLLVGRVIDSVGAPVSGAEVRVVTAAGDTRIVRTNSDGRWSMRFAAAAPWYRVAIRSIGLAPARLSVAGRDGVPVAVDVQLSQTLLGGIVARMLVAAGMGAA